MGMFDSVWVECPSCETENEIQTKAGKCVLAEYRVKDAPPWILAAISHKDVKCSACGKVYSLKVERPNFEIT